MPRAAYSKPSPREQLTALRLPLVDLHRELLELERRAYEGAHGRVAPAELLQLALQHEQFAWLHRISAVIVRIDQLTADDEAPTGADVQTVAAHIRTLLRPAPDGTPFQQQYDHAIQNDPAVVLAHRAVMQALPPAPPPARETIH